MVGVRHPICTELTWYYRLFTSNDAQVAFTLAINPRTCSTSIRFRTAYLLSPDGLSALGNVWTTGVFTRGFLIHEVLRFGPSVYVKEKFRESF